MWDRIAGLKGRKIAQWSLGYAAAAWVLIQAFDLVGEQFDWPVALVRGITVVLAMGFFAALVLAWYHGEKGRQRVSAPEIALLGIIAIATAGIISFVNRRPALRRHERRA